MVEFVVYGLYCGILVMCVRGECLNFWLKDFFVKKCEVSCCINKFCLFLMLNKLEIDRYE